MCRAELARRVRGRLIVLVGSDRDCCRNCRCQDYQTWNRGPHQLRREILAKRWRVRILATRAPDRKKHCSKHASRDHRTHHQDCEPRILYLGKPTSGSLGCAALLRRLLYITGPHNRTRHASETNSWYLHRHGVESDQVTPGPQKRPGRGRHEHCLNRHIQRLRGS